MNGEAKLCPLCNYAGDKVDKICPHCGIALISKCPKCGARIKTSFAEFCYACGTNFRKTLKQQKRKDDEGII